MFEDDQDYEFNARFDDVRERYAGEGDLPEPPDDPGECGPRFPAAVPIAPMAEGEIPF